MMNYNMAHVLELQFFVVVTMLSYLDADVRIIQHPVVVDNSCNVCNECGEKLVLTCAIDNYLPNSTMSWRNLNSSVRLVSCAGSNCNLNPAVISKYSKSEDTTTGIFNLTLLTVTRDNSGIVYLCENGLSTATSVLKVRDYRPILNETSDTTLKVRSGCINESEVLEFRWLKQKTGTDAKSYDDVIYIDTNATLDHDFCTHDTECGLNGFVTLERTIEVEPGDANDYHLIAEILYINDFKMESFPTNKTYKIGAICVFGIGDVVVFVFFGILFILHFILAIWIIYKIYKELEYSCKETIISTVPVIAFLCMSLIVYCVCKYIEKPCIFCKNIGMFGIIFGCLLGVPFFIGITLSIWAYCSKDQSKNQNYTAFFFFTFLNLIILVWFAVSDLYRRNKGKPRDFTYVESSVTHNSFKVQWKPGSVRESNSQNLTFFLVWYSQNRKEGGQSIKYNGNCDMEYVIQNLKSSTNYTVMIQAVYDKGHSAFTNALEVRTLDTIDKPKEFAFDPNSVTSNSVWLSWKPGPKRGSEHMFNLIWYTDDGNERCVDISHNGKAVMHHKLKGLLEGTTYNVKIFAECNTVKLECDTEVRFKTKEGQLTVFRKKHKRIADSCEDEICCENCKKTGASLASHAYCLSDELYLCLKCLDKEHTNEECVLLWNTDDIKGKDHKLCCKENYKRNDLQLKGVCQTCKLFICSQCIEKHEHTDCSSHQQLHGPLNTRARMCCKQNKAKGRTKTVDFCMQCKTFICASCLEHHHTHLVISNLTDVMDAETWFCCELNYKARGHESDDFCIQCKTFICVSCLKEHTNHVVISAFTGLISTRAGMCCKLENNNKIKDFCIQCQTFICDPCKKNHNRHIIVSSMMASSKREFFCKGCPSVKRLPVECLALHKGVFLCASCYETGNLKKALKNKSESQEPIVQNFTKNQKSCQVHEVLGNVKDLQVEVYCLVCQLYMCLGCFKKHRRIYDHWSKTLEGNLFYCNQCRTGEVNPVECCDFTSLEFRCWQCYILNIRTSAKLSYTKEVTSKMHDLRDMKNPCQVHEDETRSTTKADVYCLVCKSDMCKSCFKKHINSEINQR